MYIRRFLDNFVVFEYDTFSRGMLETYYKLYNRVNLPEIIFLESAVIHMKRVSCIHFPRIVMMDIKSVKMAAIKKTILNAILFHIWFYIDDVHIYFNIFTWNWTGTENSLISHEEDFLTIKNAKIRKHIILEELYVVRRN